MKKEVSNTRKAIYVLWVIMGLNILVAVAKIAVGLLANAGSILADGYHSLSDSTGNIVGIVGLSIAGRKQDSNHPYGHKKFENISSLIIGIILFAVGSKVAYNSVLNIINPKIPEIVPLSFVIMVITLFINIFVVVYEGKQGKKLSSDVLISDSKHTGSDVLITCGVIITMIFLKLGAPAVIDGIVSLIISAFIFKASIEILIEAIKPLTDSAMFNSEDIYNVAMSCEGVMGCHKIRSRGRDDEGYIDLHILTDPNMSVNDAHNLQHRLENILKERFGKEISAIIHVEPYENR